MGESFLSKLVAMVAKDCQAAAVVFGCPGCFHTAVYRIRSHEREFCETTHESSRWYSKTQLGWGKLEDQR